MASKMIPIPGPSGSVLAVSDEVLKAFEEGQTHKAVQGLSELLPTWVTARTIHRLLGIHPKDLEWGIGHCIFQEGLHYKRKGVQRRWSLQKMAQVYPMFRRKLMRNRY